MYEYEQAHIQLQVTSPLVMYKSNANALLNVSNIMQRRLTQD
jgi:hypothetical protein